MAREEGRVLTRGCAVLAAGDGRPPRVLRGVGGGDRLVALAGEEAGADAVLPAARRWRREDQARYLEALQRLLVEQSR